MRGSRAEEGMLPTTAIDLEQVRLPVADRLLAVERELRGMVPSGFEALDEVGDYLFARSGKLLRPTLLLLADGVGGRPSPDAVKLGAIVDLLHVATLVHDDAVDHSARRRGRPTVNHRWTHQVAIIAGDYLYSRAVIEVVALGKLEQVALLAHTAHRMTIGEMRQLVLHDGLDFTEDLAHGRSRHRVLDGRGDRERAGSPARGERRGHPVGEAAPRARGRSRSGQECGQTRRLRANRHRQGPSCPRPPPARRSQHWLSPRHTTHRQSDARRRLSR